MGYRVVTPGTVLTLADLLGRQGSDPRCAKIAPKLRRGTGEGEPGSAGAPLDVFGTLRLLVWCCLGVNRRASLAV